MRLSQIGRRPPRRMIRMRMIEPDNVLTPLPPFPLNANQFLADQCCTGSAANLSGYFRIAPPKSPLAVPVHLPQQHPAALVRISFLAMLPQGIKFGLADLQHKEATTETQSHRDPSYWLSLCLCDSVVKDFLSFFPKSLAQILVPRIRQNGDHHRRRFFLELPRHLQAAHDRRR